jgi:hypothetical protein
MVREHLAQLAELAFKCLARSMDWRWLVTLAAVQQHQVIVASGRRRTGTAALIIEDLASPGVVRMRFTPTQHVLYFGIQAKKGLNILYERVAGWLGVVVEFAPELFGKGPKSHFLAGEPSGIRIEFTFDPRIQRALALGRNSA